ncbi:Chromatin-remodelling complex RSC SWI/SNF subunit Rsc7/Swp82 [Penicillium bovifimosum]|uniref:Chromatin-remodelling complex RSC SWI/SNF subunit Rsc7/Swp82 n=1 Tax=Penicillium bovifimosum TaxID=126998 RepID=A0A9W9GWQ6_9EURO|nr:Chromatin-remodelling complex RSC SWI/SNF subunit Rsc7/Swp82 [Penicillium bovifimosum]KAJ5130766.1 Chromatin-remodelling complex RSC SWI/SNF subunit Rsc7/Swp82 [Penicillium bovifimosum]
MPRKLRAAAQAAAKSMKNVPTLPDGSDEEMLDAPSSHPSSPEPEPAPEPEASPEKDHDDQPEPEPEAESTEAQTGETPATPKPEEELGVSTPAEDSILPDTDNTPSYGPGRPSLPPRGKRRLGRPPKNPRPEWDPANGEEPPRVTTPVKRRRGRPAASGGRWARNRGPSHLTQVPVDKEGNMMDVINDEVSIPPDPIGATKVDENGHLQGGREYRVRTFKILGRGDRLYMLSTEPARCIGFRDSYLFFQKHKMLYKIIIDDEAKRDLIERDLIPHSYKGRAIGVVTARSVFREFGAKIIVGGKKITDDYDEAAARERGDVEGELAVPEDRLPGPGEEYNRNQYVAWHGASSVYHTNAPSVPLVGGKPVDTKRRRVPVTDDNWQLEHARSASAYNSKLAEARRANLNGVYDVHTNTMQYPKIMQPTHARWERVPPAPAATAGELATDLNSLNFDNRGSQSGTENKNPDETQESPETATAEASAASSTNTFKPVPAHMHNRYLVQDIIYESPRIPTWASPVLMATCSTLAPPTHPEFMTPEIIALLPPECKEALIDAAAHEIEWKNRWSTETQDGERTQPTKSYAWYP